MFNWTPEWDQGWPDTVWINDGTGQFPQVRTIADTAKTNTDLGDLDVYLVNGPNPNQVWLNHLDSSGLPAACIPDANGDGVVNVVDIQTRALHAACLPYLNTISDYWHEPLDNGP